MEPAATGPFLVPGEPARRKTAWRWAFWAILSLVTGGFAWGLYRARHSVMDLIHVVGDYCIAYYGLWVLYVCLRKHELLRGDDDPAAAAELRRVRFVPWALSLYLACWMALRIVSATPSLAPTFALCVLAVHAMVAARRSDARADDAGRLTEEVPHDHEVSPAQTV